MLQTFRDRLDVSETQLEYWLTLSLDEFLALPESQTLLGSLDVELLKETLPTAGQTLAKQLPPFYGWLKNELKLKRVPDSPDHTIKWTIGFLNNQESLQRLVELHRPVPLPALEASIPRLVGTFDAVEDDRVRQEWQKAISALCLVLAIAARSENREAS
ncbi:hypothetical protein JJD41_01980 [Oxynema sp. CENA135]|uniref:hypothetical protein n=1 Tax=Oxynema sp. CENA135 TaxID=984206 RepID=UPI00190BAB0A|nr:hypothetical protein [Oxynema sp. CENA135]MBK4728659.1 hypothetical protein [Oxynema sp. CENA135]